MIPGLGSQIPGLGQNVAKASSASELQKLIEAMKAQEAVASTQQADQVSIPEGAGQLKEVPFGSSLAEAQLKAQTQGPSLEVGTGAEETTIGEGGQAIAQGSTKGIAEVASALAKAQYVKEAAIRNAKRERLKGEASGRMAASKLESEGTISPLRNLIANFKAALS
jgi:hypothetical protein